ncbi:MAG TPA: ABC transporter permease [Candidatus Limnocylindrales bacterium]|nr:ABC transporter permease [Candidatus Limnocylindrales bacterium]
MTEAVLATTRRRPSAGRRFVRRAGGWEALAGLVIVVSLLLMALLAPVIAPYDPEAISSDRILAAPDLAHPFGSDSLGRDVLSRVMFAFRVSLLVAIGSVAVAFAVGAPIGLVAGFRGGWVDGLLMRPLDLLLALPALLLAVAMIAILGPGALIALLAIAIIYLPIIARVVRSAVLVVREQPYVDGARARGASELSIMIRHVLPNSLGPALVQGTVLMGFAIQIEAALSFLGLGAQPPTPSLGIMLSDGRDVLTLAPWVEIFPGLALALVVLGFNLVGDGLRRRLDPRGMAR